MTRNSVSNQVMSSLMLFVMMFYAASSQAMDDLDILVDQGQLVSLTQRAKAVFIADPDVASYQAPSSHSLFVFGKKAGTTTLYVLGNDEKVIYSRRIKVLHDVASLKALIRHQFPESKVEVTSTANRLILTGTVPSPDAADHINRLAEGFLSDSEQETVARELINQLTIDLPTQVNIRVRIAEMDRGTAREFGFDTTTSVQYSMPVKTISWATGNNLTGILKALEEESLVSILAEPNLTSVSGEEARFLAGGQFPVAQPVAANSNSPVTYEYRDFGVALNMTPTILSHNRISLKVNPSVSEFSESAYAESEDFPPPPTLTLRTTSTTVELASGQSFILGGLLHERENTVISQVPFLGDIPVLGALFRSERYTRKETELVIIATAYIVEPSSSNDFHIPQQGMKPASRWKRLLYGQILDKQSAQASGVIEESQPQLIGDYGFMY